MYVISKPQKNGPTLYLTEEGYHHAFALARRWRTLEACRTVARRIKGVRIRSCDDPRGVTIDP